MLFKAIGIGEVLWDMLPEGKQLGGAPTNFAVHIRQLATTKIDSHIISCIGDDAFGQEIRTHLQHQKINCEFLSIEPDHPTGRVDIALNKTGSPTYTINQPVAWDFIPDTAIELARQSSVVCFGSLAQRNVVSRTSIHRFLDNTPDDCLRVFDINLRQHYYNRNVIEASLQQANILKINTEELKIVAELLQLKGNEQQLLQSICTRFKLRLGILTRGSKGSLLIGSKSMHLHPGKAVQVIDTVGAGDAFTAAVAIGLLKQFDLDYINDCANRVAAFVCSHKGATPTLNQKLSRLFD